MDIPPWDMARHHEAPDFASKERSRVGRFSVVRPPVWTNLQLITDP